MMHRILLWLLLVSGALGFAPWHSPLAAKQLRFDKQNEGDKVAFRYRYQDNAQRTEEINFSLPTEAIKASEALLLNDVELNRAARDFTLREGQATVAKYLSALQAEFDAEAADIQSAIATFNGKIGWQAVSLTFPKSQNLKLEFRLSGKNLLGWNISSRGPSWRTSRNTEEWLTRRNTDTEAIVARANESLPKESRFVVVKDDAGGINVSLKDEPPEYGISARTNKTMRKMNARLRKGWARHKKDLNKTDKFLEGMNERLHALSTKTSQRLTSAQKDVSAEMKIKRPQFYAAHYLLPSQADENRTQIDYARIATEAQVRLRPVALAFRAKFKDKNTSEREQIAEVLRFFQNIPYNDLTKGKVRGFKGFSPPTEMITQNLGDCDSKSTAMMGLLRLLVADRSVAIFIVPEHAFLGVEMQPREGDARHIHLGKTYVLMEPTGPGVSPIGSLAKDSRKHLQAGRLEEVITLSSP